MIYAYGLRLPFEFKDTYIGVDALIQKYSNIDTNLDSLLKDLGLCLMTGERFYLQPGQFLPVHVDNDYFNDYTKLNFIFGGAGSCVKWFEPNPGTNPAVKKTPIGSGYLIPKNVSDVTETFTFCKVGPMIINPGHYHAVFNGTTEPRITYSFMLKDVSTGTHLQWNKAVEKFKDYLI